MIVAHALTEPTVDDATIGIDLIETVDDEIARVTADAAYETVAFYERRGCVTRLSWFHRPRPRGCLGVGRGRAREIARSRT